MSARIVIHNFYNLVNYMNILRKHAMLNAMNKKGVGRNAADVFMIWRNKTKDLIARYYRLSDTK